jgi:hypothetical protein
MAEEQPVVLGAIGLALGAAIGAVLPSTRTENRYLGPTSDALKGQVKSAAHREYEHVKDVAGEAYEEVKEDLDKRGFSAEAAADAVSSAAGKAGDATDKLVADAKSEAAKADAGKPDVQRPGIGGAGRSVNPTPTPASGPGGSPYAPATDQNKPKT